MEVHQRNIFFFFLLEVNLKEIIFPKTGFAQVR